MNTLAIVGLVAGIIVALPALWCTVVLALSHISGWQTLAATFEAKAPPSGVQFVGQSGSIGGVSYRNLLIVNVAKDGLFLAVPVLFKIGHKPLFIPWSAIKDQKAVKFLWHEAISVQVGPAIKISLPRVIFEGRNAPPAAQQSVP